MAGHINIPELKVHQFKVKEHIDLHWPLQYNRQPSPGMTFSEIRPILRKYSNLSKSCAGSQTDISALGNEIISSEENSDQKKWTSEPSLVIFEKSANKIFSSKSSGCARKIYKFEIPAVKKAQIDWDAFDKLKNFDYDHMNCELKKENSQNSGSTDSLIEEAENFLQIAKSKLVTTQDWSTIKNKVD